jgi:hypothetical protein
MEKLLSEIKGVEKLFHCQPGFNMTIVLSMSGEDMEAVL